MARLTIDDVYEHAHDVCFRTGPPGRVGAESEWLIADPLNPAEHISLARLRGLMDAAGPLPADGLITYEPGGQIEVSTRVHDGPAAACSALETDLNHVRRHLAAGGLAFVEHGVDPVRPPLQQLRNTRYKNMAAYFGPSGLAMMCTTASIQVCVDIGADRAAAARRWSLLHALGPVFVAAFANSPLRAGRLTGWRSSRQALWARLDPHRTGPVAGADPAASWARYALDAHVMGGANAGRSFRDWLARGSPSAGDLTYHLSTLFPPVRPRGWFELRMIDALPQPYVPVPIAVVAALIDDPVAASSAAEAAEPAAGRWREAAQRGLSDPVLGKAARHCFELALDALSRLGVPATLRQVVDEYAARYVDHGRCPADDITVPGPRSKG